MQTDRRKLRQIIAKHFGTDIDDARVCSAVAEIRGEDKFGKVDPFDTAMAFMMPPEVVAEKKILDDLESGLHLNILRDDKAARNARLLRADIEANPSHTVEKWLEWVRAEPWRLAHLNIYRDTDKIWSEWPQAFVDDSAKYQRTLPPMLD